MEEMRQIRNLKKALESEYGQRNCGSLAERLVGTGVADITDELRRKINYLQTICDTVPFDDFLSEYIISRIDESEIRERYAQVVFYTHKEKCDISDLVLSCEEVSDFATYLKSIGFDQEQISVSLRKLIGIGSFAKKLDEARETVGLLSCFELSDKVRNQFICENFELLFNDYSRKLKELFSSICEKYGTEDGFKYLCQNPMIIRMGMK